MKFVAVLSKRIPLGRSLNALAHMSIGLGHRVHGKPDIAVYFAEPEEVRKFNALSRRFEKLIKSDFTDTMTGDTAVEQLEKTKAKRTEELEYYASCGLFEDNLPREVLRLLENCQQLQGYTAVKGDAGMKILDEQRVDHPAQVPDRKLCMVVNKKQPPEQLLNAAVATCLQVGAGANLADLRLLNFVDASRADHSGISFYGFPVLTAKSPAKLAAMIAADKQNLVAASSADMLTVFGETAAVDALIPRKETSMLQLELDEKALEPADLRFFSPAATDLAASMGFLAGEVKSAPAPGLSNS